MIYLDWNVIADLESDKLPTLEKKLFDLKKRKSVVIPFSSIHIEEASNIESREEIDKRLDYISKLTSDLYFVNNIQFTGYRVIKPKSVYEIMDKSVSDNYMEEVFYKMINYDVLRNVRKLLNLSPSRLNNIKPEEAVHEIDKILLSEENREKYLKDYNGDLSFMGLITTVIDIIEQVFPFKLLYYQNKYNKMQNFIIMIFLTLDSLGFWPEKRETHDRGSHRVDSEHAFNGAFTDLVISADKRFCMKSRATYSMLGINTKVLNVKIDKSEVMKTFEII